MRRLPLAWILPLLLLVVQHGAVLHELAHLRYAGGALSAQLSDDQRLPDNSLCPTCQAFAQLTHPATASAPGLALPLAAPIRVGGTSTFFTGARAPRPRSRGPPSPSV